MSRSRSAESTDESTDELIELIAALVRIASRGGVDSYTPIVEAVSGWLTSHDVSHEVLRDGDRPIAICGSLEFSASGPAYLLNATLDTAPFGDESQWTDGPLSAAIRDGWLYGRGSSDSKSGVAIFLHTLATLRQRNDLNGALAFLFDADEHSGDFTGARRFIEHRGPLVQRLQGVCIGYPGSDRLVIGCRGFERARIVVCGEPAHSGASTKRGVNAIQRAARLIERLSQITPPHSTDSAFPLPPTLTVTEIHGGEGFSTVPGSCVVSIDARLTPSFTRVDARRLLEEEIRRLDLSAPAPQPTRIDYVGGWPSFLTPADDRMVLALQTASRLTSGADLPTTIAGPSNVGNLFATLGIPVTAGYGVRYRNLHGLDECIELSTLGHVAQVYHKAMEILLQNQ